MRTCVLLVVTSLAGAVRGQGFADLVWETQGCVTVSPATLEVGTCLPGACSLNASRAEAIAPLPGTFMVELTASLDASNAFTTLFVTAGGQIVHLQGDAPWCLPAPCTLVLDLAFHVDAGDLIAIDLEAIELGCATGGTLCHFADWRFEPDVGFFADGPGLDGATLQAGTGAQSSDFAGQAVAYLGDLDGDGVQDLAFGSIGEGFAGSVRVLSGRTGELLLTVQGSTFAENFGRAVTACGDVDADGVPDLAVGAPESDQAAPSAGCVRILSGADGSLLRELLGGSSGEQFGSAVAAAGDVDGDGLPDLLVGAPNRAGPAGAFGAGAAFVISGASGATLLLHPGTVLGEQLGTSVAGLDDLDGDGVPDLAFGAPGEGPSIPTNLPGRAVIVSGATAAVLGTLFGDAPDDKFGFDLANAGDVDGDGRGDLLIGAPQDAFQGAFDGYARVVSGGTLQPLVTLVGGPDEALGRAVAGAGDLDGDGRAELALGGPRAASFTGVVRLVADAGATTWLEIHGEAPNAWLGEALGGAADLDGDGVPDVLCGAGHASPGPTSADLFKGQWAVYSGAPSDHGAPELTGSGSLVPGSTVTLDLQGAKPFAPATLVLGFDEANLPFKDGILVPHPDVLLGGFVTDAAGAIASSATWPSGVPSGFAFWLQSWIVDAKGPAGFTASNGLLVLAP